MAALNIRIMNTHLRGLRPVLATVAAGALILGTAGAASAAPKAKTPKPGAVTISKVDIKRHSPINVESLDTARDLKVKITLRDTDPTATVTGATVSFAQYDKKVNGQLVAPSTVSISDLVLTSPKVGKKSVTFTGVVAKASLVAAGVADDSTALVCLSGVVLTITDSDTTAVKKSQQTQRRLGEGTKKPVRECIRLVNPKTPVVQ